MRKHRPLTDDEMRACIKRARAIAAPVGPMHSHWDTIADADAILNGRHSILNRQQIEEQFCQMFPDLLS